MGEKLSKIMVIIFFVLIITYTLIGNVIPDKKISETERRVLKQKPKIDFTEVLSGRYSIGLEKYFLDQIFCRDDLRAIKSRFEYSLLGKKDIHNVYYKEGIATDIMFENNNSAVDYFNVRIDYLYKKYFENTECNLYLSVIPDKLYYMSSKYHLPTFDYNEMMNEIRYNNKEFEYIDLFSKLSLDDYYKMDSHWRQESLLPIADHILLEMNKKKVSDLEWNKKLATELFYGVYSGQTMLGRKGEELYYMDHPIFRQCEVINYESNEKGYIYYLDKIEGRDPYEVFLAGPVALLTITNLEQKNNNELVVFRDSFGSSLIPLLVPEYQKITVVDIRYISSDLLSEYITFERQDVLVIYNVSVINESSSLK